MKILDVIEHFGSVKTLSFTLGVSHQAVYQWKRKGEIPPLWQYKLQEITRGKLKRTRS